MMGDTKGTDWMYNPNAEMNKEEYLLGKAIGKNFENEGTMGQINAVEYDCAPPSIFASQAAHQVDLQRKLIEDPLVAIKKRELEDRRKILDNPVKMKALQEHIEDLKRKKKDKKKKKKRKKTKGSDSDDSDADLDLKLLKRIQKMEEGGGDSEDEFEEPGARKEKGSESPVERNGKDQRQRGSPPSRRQRSGGSPSKRQRQENSPPRRKRSHSPLKRRQLSDSPPRRRRSPSSPPRRKRSPETQPRRRNRSPDSPPRRRRSPDSPPRRKMSPDSPPRRRRSPESGRRRSPYRRERKYSRSPARRVRSPHRRKPRSPSDSPPRIKERSPYKRKTSSPSSSPPRRKSPTMSPPPKKKAGLDIGRNYRKKSPVVKSDRENSSKKAAERPAKKVALTDSEKQAKLAEMMANATWRDQQRTSRVQSYREGMEKEEAEASKEHDKNFINRELKRAQENLTVEGRITANKYKIQRGHGDMDKNFARR